MKKLLARIKLVFNYGDEIDALLQEKRDTKALGKRAYDAHRLKLCHKHRQEPNQSHFAESNCDYCRAIKGTLRTIDKLPGED